MRMVGITPRARVACTVVICILMGRRIKLHTVSAGRAVPVPFCIVQPCICRHGVLTAAAVAAGVAEIIVILILVRIKSVLDVVSAGGSMPVIVGIAAPFPCKLVLVIAAISADVTNAVVLLVGMRSGICLLVGMLTGSGIPVAVLIKRPLVCIRMRMRLLRRFVTSNQSQCQKQASANQ